MTQCVGLIMLSTLIWNMQIFILTNMILFYNLYMLTQQSTSSMMQGFRRQICDLNGCWVTQNLVEYVKQACKLSTLKMDSLGNRDTVMKSGYAL